jgi:hypothetical protein
VKNQTTNLEIPNVDLYFRFFVVISTQIGERGMTQISFGLSNSEQRSGNAWPELMRRGERCDKFALG